MAIDDRSTEKEIENALTILKWHNYHKRLEAFKRRLHLANKGLFFHLRLALEYHVANEIKNPFYTISIIKEKYAFVLSVFDLSELLYIYDPERYVQYE